VTPPRASVKLKINGFLRIPMRDGFHAFPDVDLNPELLPQLTMQAFPVTFRGTAFASGEFP
jgi:hypothetical protein